MIHVFLSSFVVAFAVSTFCSASHVEIIKGTASALYGSSALGGVIDLISRRPDDETERTVLLNQTSRNGTDAVFFGSANPAAHPGATLLAGAAGATRSGW